MVSRDHYYFWNTTKFDICTRGSTIVVPKVSHNEKKGCDVNVLIIFMFYHSQVTEEANERTGRRIDPQTISVQQILRNYRNSLRNRKASPLPNYGRTQPSNFSCTNGLGPGYYADPAFGCQQYYRCDDRLRRSVFICPPGTLFNQVRSCCFISYVSSCEKYTNGLFCS